MSTFVQNLLNISGFFVFTKNINFLTHFYNVPMLFTYFHICWFRKFFVILLRTSYSCKMDFPCFTMASFLNIPFKNNKKKPEPGRPGPTRKFHVQINQNAKEIYLHKIFFDTTIRSRKTGNRTPDQPEIFTDESVCQYKFACIGIFSIWPTITKILNVCLLMGFLITTK